MNDIVFMVNARRPSTDSNIEFIYKVPRQLPDGTIMSDETIYRMLELSKINTQQMFEGWEIELIM